MTQGKKTYALYRDEEGKLYATDGICTHGNTHLADGLVKGKIIDGALSSQARQTLREAINSISTTNAK